MDPLSQGTVGVAFAQSIANKNNIIKIGIIGFFAGLAPDLDVLIRSENDPILFLEYHRQFSHSLFFIPFGSLIVALLIFPLFKKSMSLKTIYMASFLGYATHGLLDACTSYGTLLFWPFSNERVTWNNISIIDPLFTIPVLILIGIAIKTRKKIFSFKIFKSEDNFKNTLLQGLISHDAVTGSNLGPRSPGSLINLLFRMANHNNSLFGGIQQAKGGVNAVIKSLEDNVVKRGVEIKTSSFVKRCIIENDQVKGIELDDGTLIHADTVISSADPKSTYFCLLGAEHLDTDFKRRVKHHRSKGRVSKLQLTLNKVPEFKNLESTELSQRLVISPSIDYIEENFNYSKFENLSPEPILEFSIPSLEDDTLCQDGQHIMNIQIQYAPFNVKGGWENKKTECIDNVLTILEKYAPGIKSCISRQDFISPNDIEKNFNVTGGHWHHGEIQIDQLFMLRPIPGAAQYKTPVNGLYMCGAGTHPGGGMTGIPGKNAAHEVLKNI